MSRLDFVTCTSQYTQGLLRSLFFEMIRMSTPRRHVENVHERVVRTWITLQSYSGKRKKEIAHQQCSLGVRLHIGNEALERHLALQGVGCKAVRHDMYPGKDT